MNTKRVIIPIIISVATLILLTVGATYAYFSVNTTNNFGTKTITTSAESVGNVALSTGNNLILDLTAKDMMNQGSDLAYYASSSGKTTTPTIEKIGTATVTGEGMYNCTYKLTMNDNSNSMYDVFQGMNTKSAGQIILTVNGTEYDFNTSGLFSKEISGTMYGLTSDEARDITASLKIVNKTIVDQTALAGSNITITFSATAFECSAVEERLPSTYQEVEYLESTGTQYIDTGFIPTKNAKSIVKYLNPIPNDTGYWGCYGVYTGNNTRHQIFGVLETSYTLGLGSGSVNITKDSNIHTAILDNKNAQVTFDGVIQTPSSNKFTSTTAGGTAYIFGANQPNKYIYASRIYFVKQYDSNVLVHNFIPSYRKSDNVGGMYDLVENKFYINAGSGTFIVGSNV